MPSAYLLKLLLELLVVIVCFSVLFVFATGSQGVAQVVLELAM